jgi:hypothetical protein
LSSAMVIDGDPDDGRFREPIGQIADAVSH